MYPLVLGEENRLLFRRPAPPRSAGGLRASFFLGLEDFGVPPLAVRESGLDFVRPGAVA